jgi:hypothetical protein
MRKLLLNIYIDRRQFLGGFFHQGLDVLGFHGHISQGLSLASVTKTRCGSASRK